MRRKRRGRRCYGLVAIGPEVLWLGSAQCAQAGVLKHLARGKTNKEIARDLDVSPKTVDTHLQPLFRKIGAHTRSAAAM